MNTVKLTLLLLGSLMSISLSTWAADAASGGPSCAAVFSSTDFKSAIQPGSDGKPSLWITEPPANGQPEASYEFGSVVTLKAGTKLYHWGQDDKMGHLISSGLTNEMINESIKKNDESDEYGGGFYVSTSPGDSAQYGKRVVMMTLSHDIQVV